MDCFFGRGAGSITFSNGTTVVLARMERPVLVLDDGGLPLYLVNGVQPRSGDAHTFTLIQTVRRE